VNPEDLDYLNAHATSTPVGDMSEIRAMSKLFLGKNRIPLISATKSMTGHLLGAAGAIEAIACVLSIDKGMIPPTINTLHPDPDIPAELPIVYGEAREATVRTAMSNTFGFGGHNGIVVFRGI
jgi:3-oxoacyl-[acyl-carrier-protein] synthase II